METRAHQACEWGPLGARLLRWKSRLTYFSSRRCPLGKASAIMWITQSIFCTLELDSEILCQVTVGTPGLVRAEGGVHM